MFQLNTILSNAGSDATRINSMLVDELIESQSSRP